MTVEERRLLTALANCRLPAQVSPIRDLCLKILKAVTKFRSVPFDKRTERNVMAPRSLLSCPSSGGCSRIS